MASKNYVSGRGFEYRVLNWLRDRGYYVVRSYASKGIFDLVATPPKSSRFRGTFLIQAKYSRTGKVKISSKEKSRLAASSRRYSATCILAYNENRSLRFKLVNPYLLKDVCECSGKMGREYIGFKRYICKECGVG